MKVLLLLVLGLLALIGCEPSGPQPETPRSLVVKQAIAQWVNGRPLGVEKVDVDKASSNGPSFEIRYSVVPNRELLPYHRRALLRAVLENIKAHDLEQPSYILVYSVKVFTGETGKRWVGFVEPVSSAWGQSTDMIEEKKLN